MYCCTSDAEFMGHPSIDAILRSKQVKVALSRACRTLHVHFGAAKIVALEVV